MGILASDLQDEEAGLAIIRGTRRGDFLEGTAANDRIFGLAGADLMFGDDGNDFLDGGDGDDLLFGEAGNDDYFGGEGDDFLRSASGVDSYDGGAGFDRIGFSNGDAITGVFADLRTGEIRNDGFNNAETMISIEALGSGTLFSDTFFGNNGDNLLFTDRGDIVSGFGGDDIIWIGSVDSTVVSGGSGNDTVRLAGFRSTRSAGPDLFTEDATHGAIIDLGTGRVIDDGFGFGGRITSFENVVGTNLGDLIKGNGGPNVLNGLGGNDTIEGGAGDDLLIGGGSKDQMEGGNGSDVFIFGERESGNRINTADLIVDFGTTDRNSSGESVGDKINLESIDAIVGGGDDGFAFIGNASFSANSGELRFEFSDGNTVVSFDKTGDGVADMMIVLQGTIPLSAGDFVL